MTLAHDTTPGRLSMNSRNRLKLGVFGPNCSSGLAKTQVPERWSGSWRDNLALAQMLDEAGMDFILPVGRWMGYGGATNPQAEAFETVTWATGLLGATRRIVVFGTVHASLIHPVFAAKMCVTADHAGEGRFGLNIVCGSHKNEFEMFGEPMRENEPAYAHGTEWIEIVLRLWEQAEPFDYHGEYFRLEHAQALPKPYGGTRPLILNAANSPAGKRFAMRFADGLFTSINEIERVAEEVRMIQTGAAAAGRSVSVCAPVNIVCRPTVREAQDYYRYFADEMADWESLKSREADWKRRQQTHYDALRDDGVRQAAGYGGYPCVGDPEHVARELADLSAAGLTGIAIGFVNYLDEFPYFHAEVLPRLEALGIREKNR